jgi:hypothetical protein
LFLGTIQDNSNDAVSKRRHAFGERTSSAKITEGDVLEIRRRYDAGDLPSEIAPDFGLSPQHVIGIGRGRFWSHLPGAVAGGRIRMIGNKKSNAKLNDDLVRSIRSRVAAGESQASIARELNFTTTLINNAVKRKTWKHVA